MPAHGQDGSTHEEMLNNVALRGWNFRTRETTSVPPLEELNDVTNDKVIVYFEVEASHPSEEPEAQEENEDSEAECANMVMYSIPPTVEIHLGL